MSGVRVRAGRLLNTSSSIRSCDLHLVTADETHMGVYILASTCPSGLLEDWDGGMEWEESDDEGVESVGERSRLGLPLLGGWVLL